MNAPGPDSSNSKYAWRELDRQGLPKRSAAERVSDFLEIYGLYDEAAARAQASRCLQCPNPGCVHGCPLCNPIPQWMLLTAEGRFLEASAVLGSASNLADVCARLCPTERLCEAECVLSGPAEPVAIRALEQFLGEYAAAHGQVDASTAPPNGRRVAVVGSGPGGLACADELAKRGYAVTVLDSALVPGGLMLNGMPAFKLDGSVVARRVEILRRRGVVFRLGAGLWADLSLGQLEAQFDAVYLGFDARQARPLPVPGADLPGVIQAFPFLLQKTTPVRLDAPPLEVAGKRVVVVGAGDTAMDCLRAALRYGAREAVCVYRRDEADMPCSRREYRNAVEEGARFMFRATPVAVQGRDGRVASLRLIGVSSKHSTFATNVERLELTPAEFDLETDCVVTALGFDPAPLPETADFSRLVCSADGRVIVDQDQMTNLPSVFAGGDLVRGPSLVLDAVRDARAAAAAIARRLEAGLHV